MFNPDTCTKADTWIKHTYTALTHRQPPHTQVHTHTPEGRGCNKESETLSFSSRALMDCSRCSRYRSLLTLPLQMFQKGHNCLSFRYYEKDGAVQSESRFKIMTKGKLYASLNNLKALVFFVDPGGNFIMPFL